jgi:predicted TPR repeat methyltransferase
MRLGQSTTMAGAGMTKNSPMPRHRIALPESSHAFDQGVEWMVVELADGWREINSHDYAAIYELPGLYEQIFRDVLKCDTPRHMCEFLRRGLAAEGASPERLRVLDLGAGNGMMGEQLRALGAGLIVGIDLLEAAAAATERDRPGCYDDYLVMNLAEAWPVEQRRMREQRFNTLTCVGGLDRHPTALECFQTAFNLLGNGGWVVLSVHDDPDDSHSLGELVRAAVRTGALEIVRSEVYQHRLTTTGQPLHHTGILARKCAPLLARPRPPAD